MKKYIYLLAIFATVLFTAGCAKDTPASGYVPQNTETVVYPTSDTPIEFVVTVSMTYDKTAGEYVFTADKVFPCDIKFKTYRKYGGVAYYALKKGTKMVRHPFDHGDVNAPKDFYEISLLKHWKCNNDEKNEYVHGNITYRFYYSLSGQNAEDNQNAEVI